MSKQNTTRIRSMDYHEMNREHIRARREEGWVDTDIADIMHHSLEWVRQYI